MANNFDYSKNVFTHSGAFESLRFNSFRKAPEIQFDVSISFLNELEKVKIHRSQKARKIKLILLSASLIAFWGILLLLMAI